MTGPELDSYGQDFRVFFRDEIEDLKNKREDQRAWWSENKDNLTEERKNNLFEYVAENHKFNFLRLLIEMTLDNLEDVEKLLEELKEKYEEGEYWLCRVIEARLQMNAILLVTGEKIRLLGINEKNKSLHSTAEAPYEGLEIRNRGKKLLLENGIEGERKELEILLRESKEVDEAKDKILSYIEDKDLDNVQGRWISKENVKEYQEALKSINEGFRHFTPDEFEYFIAYLFQEKGFDVEVTPQSNDYGVDVIAEDEESKIAIQVKRKKPGNTVGSKTVRETLGSMHKQNADKSILVTTSSFTNPAKEQSRDSPIQLWDREILREEIKKIIL